MTLSTPPYRPAHTAPSQPFRFRCAATPQSLKMSQERRPSQTRPPSSSSQERRSSEYDEEEGQEYERNEPARGRGRSPSSQGGREIVFNPNFRGAPKEQVQIAIYPQPGTRTFKGAS